ncbi:MAG: helix-turn-helix domain-containing protein, partial [Streptosporangiaceae bacterium]
MSDFGSSAARQRRLADELRRLRRRVRLTGKDVSTRFGWSEAKLSRIENGQARVKIEDLDGLLDLYEVASPRRAELVALAQESREAGLLEVLEGEVPAGHFGIVDAESEAETVWN